jgi:hypothetical protein
MIGCVMLLPLAGLLMAMNAVTTVLLIGMGMFMTSLIACSTAFLAFLILIFS